MKLLRIALLIFGVGMMANAMADRRTREASIKLGLGVAALVAYELLATYRAEKDGIQSVTKPPGVKSPHSPGGR